MTAPPDKTELDIAILGAALERRRRGAFIAPMIDEALEDDGRWHPKVVAQRLERLIERGYLDCGVSARSSWITVSGMERLGELEARLRGSRLNICELMWGEGDGEQLQLLSVEPVHSKHFAMGERGEIWFLVPTGHPLRGVRIENLLGRKFITIPMAIPEQPAPEGDGGW